MFVLFVEKMGKGYPPPFPTTPDVAVCRCDEQWKSKIPRIERTRNSLRLLLAIQNNSALHARECKAVLAAGNGFIFVVDFSCLLASEVVNGGKASVTASRPSAPDGIWRPCGALFEGAPVRQTMQELPSCQQ